MQLSTTSSTSSTPNKLKQRNTSLQQSPSQKKAKRRLNRKLRFQIMLFQNTYLNRLNTTTNTQPPNLMLRLLRKLR